MTTSSATPPPLSETDHLRQRVQQLEADLQTLRHSEEKYRSVFTHASDSIFIVDPYTSRIVDANFNAARRLGYSVAELCELTYEQIEAQTPENSDEVRRSMESGTTVFECAHLRKDGSLMPVEVSTRLIIIHNESYLQVFARDITERKLADEALRASEARYRALFNGALDAIILENGAEDILDANPAACALLGYAYGDLLQQHMETLQPPDVRHRPVNLSNTFETQVIHQDGAVIPVEVSIARLEEDDETLYLSIVRDITERKQMENALRESEERFRLLANVAFEAIVIHDYGEILDVNSSAEALFGYPAQAMIGRHVREFFPPEGQTILMKQVESRSETPYETVAQRANGEIFPVEIVGKAIPYNGRMVRAGAVRDLTERRRAEQHALQLAMEQERVRLLERFIGDASHDLRTPLTSMKVSLAVLGRSQDPDQRSEHRAILSAQIAHLERMLEDLISMVRLDRDSDTRQDRFDLNDLVRLITTRYETLAVQKRQAFQAHISEAALPVWGSQTQLNLALSALVNNAIHYTPEGGQITVRSCKQDDQHIVEVQDSGIGIAPADQARIFERFFRADEARQADQGGTGLGLAIARKVIENHAGRIEVESAPGAGSTFRVILPRSAEQ